MTQSFRVPGPLGQSFGSGGGRVPGPLRYKTDATGQAQSATAKSKQGGITVNAASKISAEQWAKMFKANPDLPDFIEDPLGWTKDSLTNPQSLQVPKNTRGREWLSDYVAAFASDQWELSTCHLEVTGQVDASGPKVSVTVVPHLSSGEKLGGLAQHELKQTWAKTDDVLITFGWTFEKFDPKTSTGASLASKRGLVLIANQVFIKLGAAVQTLNIEETKMVQVLVHELAVHAGRISEGLTNTHGDPTVERLTTEIEDEFAKPPPNSAKAQFFEQVEKFLTDAKNQSKGSN